MPTIHIHNDDDQEIILTEALEAIKARIMGEFDNAQLMKIGPLSTDTETDILHIIASAVRK